MRVCVNREDCIGCQFCTDIVPDVFGIDEGVAFPKSDIRNRNYNAVQEAIEGCPVGAITVESNSEVA